MANPVRRGRPPTGRAPRFTRHVKLDTPTDDALIALSNRSRWPINRLLKLAVKRLLEQPETVTGSAISGAQKNTDGRKPS